MLETGVGAIIFTKIDHEIKYVVSKDKNGTFDFLKGLVKDNENDKEAIARIIHEDLGLEVELVPNFEKEIYYTTQEDNNKRVVFFLAKYEGQDIQQNNPKFVYELMPYKKAKEAVLHNDTSWILDRANDVVFKDYYKSFTK